MLKPQFLIFLIISLAFSVETFSQRIFWSEPNSNRIMVATLSPTGISGTTIFKSGLTGPRDLAVDVGSNRLFYADNYGEDIIAANLTTGAVMSTVITTGGMVYFEDITFSENLDAIYGAMNSEASGVTMIPASNNDSGSDVNLPLGGLNNDHFTGVAMHDGNEEVFILDNDNQAIYLTDASGSSVSAVYSTSGLENVAVDTKNNKLFFTRLNGLNNEIYTSNLNGTSATLLANVGTGQITSITVYPQFGKVYYTKEGVGIYSTNLDGTANTLLVSGGVDDVAVQADITAPIFTTLIPADNSTDIATSTTLSLTFNESIKVSTTTATSIESSFRVYRSDNTLVHTIGRSSGSLSIAGNTVTLSGLPTLTNNTTYYVLAGNKVISDQSGNDWVGITLNTGWNFTTVPPVMITAPSGTTCPGSYITLGNIVITEASSGNFSNAGNQTLTFSFAASGYAFEVGTGTVSFIAGRNITAASISVTSNSITVNYSLSGTTALDALTISGLKYTTSSQTNPGVDISRSGGTGVIEGLAAGTVVGSVYSQPPPAAPVISYPSGSTFCQGDLMSGIIVSATGSANRWYTDPGLSSELASLNGNNSATSAALGIDPDVPASYLFYATQTSAGCQSTGSTVTITVNSAPEAIDQNISVCSSEANAVNLTNYNNAVNGGAASTTVSWYNDEGRTSPIANPSSTSVTNGISVYAQVLNTVTNCFRMANVTFTVIPGPTVSALSPQVCEDLQGTATAVVNLTTYNNTLTGGNSNLTVSWYSATDIPISNPYGESVTDGEVFHARVTDNPTTCYSIANVTFDIQTLPTANAGPDQTTCGTSVTLAANTPAGTGSWSVSSGSGGNFGNASSATSTFTGITGTTYLLRWTVNSTCINKDSVSIQFLSQPAIITHPSPQTACEGSPAMFYVEASGASLTYQWQVDQGGVFTNVADGGVYSGATTTQLQISDVTGKNNFLYRVIVQSAAACPVTSSSASLTTSAKPVVANQTKTACENPPGSGTAVVDLTSMNAGITGGASNRSVTWYGDPTFTSPVSTPTNVYATTGTIFHALVNNTVTNCTASATGTITVNPSPEVTPAPSLKTICNGTSTALTFNSVPSGAAYTWTVSVNANITGASASSAPSVFSINQTLTNSSTIQQTITYVVTPTGSNGCVGTAFNQDIAVQPSPTTANAGSDKTVCTTSTTLAGNTPLVGTGTWSFFGNSTGAVIANAPDPQTPLTGAKGSTYVLRWTISVSGCTSTSDDVTIQFLQDPSVANAGTDVVACNNSGNLSANTPTVGTGQWIIVNGDGGTLSNPSLPNSMFQGVPGNSYILRWTISNACTSNLDEVNVTLALPPIPANAGPDQNICASSATLAANTPSVGTGMWTIVSGPGGTITTPSSPSSTFTGNKGVTYVLAWTTSNTGCPSSSDQVSIRFDPSPVGTGTISGNAALCSDATTSYSIAVPIMNATSYDWQVQGGAQITGSATGASVSIQGLTPGPATITATGKNNCGNGGSAQLQVIILPKPNVSIVLPAAAVATEAVPFILTSPPGVTPLWNLGNGTSAEMNPVVTYDAAGTYQISVEVTDANGCKGMDTKSLEVRAVPALSDVAIKNVITANGDGHNDNLTVVGIEKYPDNEVVVVDRWGTEVFRQKGYNNDWDARDGEKYIPSGNYVCVVRYSGKVFSRTVTVIKEQ